MLMNPADFKRCFLNRISFYHLLKPGNLYHWHKPGEGLLLLGKNKDFTSDFGKYALRPAFDEGIFSFLVLGQDSVDSMELSEAERSRTASLNLDEISKLDLNDIYDLVDSILNTQPLAFFLTLPTYDHTFYSQEEKIAIRSIIQQVIMWLESNFNPNALDVGYSGVFHLDHPEKYLSKEQSGLINQINSLKRKNYSTGFHFYLVPKNIDSNAGILHLFEEQSFILMLDPKLKRNVGIFNLFRSKSLETRNLITKCLSFILPCPRTLISQGSIP